VILPRDLPHLSDEGIGAAAVDIARRNSVGSAAFGVLVAADDEAGRAELAHTSTEVLNAVGSDCLCFRDGLASAAEVTLQELVLRYGESSERLFSHVYILI